MKKVSFVLSIVWPIVVIGLCVWSVVLHYMPKPSTPAPAPTPTQYTLYVGTCDKDTYVPMDQDAARDIVEDTMLDYFSDGYTMYTASGVWRDEHDVVTHEFTFVCVLISVEKEKVYQAVDELLVKLNQSTILIVSNASSAIDFYTGA